MDLFEEYEKLKEAHSIFLRKYGVTLPSYDSQQAIILILLHTKILQLVSLEEIRDFVRSHIPEGSKDIQPRHLKYQGWHVLLSGKSSDVLPVTIPPRNIGDKLPNGFVMLASVNTPSPDFVLKRRRGNIGEADWEELLLLFDNRCAVCNRATKLEKGHKDPNLGFVKENLLPMCSACNNWASSDFIFNNEGRIVALNSVRLVEKSDLRVQIMIYDWLKKKKEVSG